MIDDEVGGGVEGCDGGSGEDEGFHGLSGVDVKNGE